ncbi:hypothetical protein BST28_17435 [Mycolicibacter kumamotonensis]|uniref:Uncharacterized protein n=1 Tax=Mycolicibacter kumamotonensis TaxID=354243 RepID=A0A1X0DZ54_9MYCO|nr:hypothetical protein BST28_17435 [Mycolicibacter kumamotonensis]
MDELEWVLAAIDEVLAEGEPDLFPWTDAARWTPSLADGDVEGWAVDLDPRLASWYRRWDPDPSAPPWVLEPWEAEGGYE